MKDPEQLAAAHWKYVNGLLQAYGVKTGAADEYMYRATFVHGYKHGMEAAGIESGHNKERGNK